MLFFFYFRHIRRYAHDVPWIHMGSAVLGNVSFVVGSLFFPPSAPDPTAV
jgi:hypothetical protein